MNPNTAVRCLKVRSVDMGVHAGVSLLMLGKEQSDSDSHCFLTYTMNTITLSIIECLRRFV